MHTAMQAYLVPGTLYLVPCTWYLVLDKVGICWNGECRTSGWIWGLTVGKWYYL
jgi:hypothetical protein